MYQLGYRALFSTTATLNVALFISDYDGLRGLETLPDSSIGITNTTDGEVRGAEIWGTWQIADDWRVTGGLTLLDRDLAIQQPYKSDPNPLLAGQTPEGNDPSSQWMIRSEYDFGRDKELDLALRRVAALSNSDVSSYTAVDARLAWWPSPSVEFSLTGRNLLDDRHVEFASSGSNVEIRRSLMLGWRWNF